MSHHKDDLIVAVVFIAVPVLAILAMAVLVAIDILE